MEDIRLYTFGSMGTLEKLGRLKTDSRGVRQRHFFYSVEEAEIRVKVLKTLYPKAYKEIQFLVVRYFSPETLQNNLSHRAKIVSIIN